MPTPASTITGTLSRCLIVRIAYWLSMPSPDPIGDASGITHTAPASSRRSAVIRSSFVYAITLNPSAASTRVASSVAAVSGSSVS